jgi:predicted AAA+ superfamily ATPase
LAGRIVFHHLPGLDVDEVGAAAMQRLWLRGGFPRSFVAPSLAASATWRAQFVRTFLERDIPSLGLRLPASTLHRFWSMLAHWHGQVLNLSELGRSFGVSDMAVRHYLDVLTGTFVVRQLQPWFANVSKRQVKSPKVYLADSGLLHTLLGVEELRSLERHPKVGASWEGFLLNEVVSHLGVDWEQCFFWATHAGAELDLLIVDGRRRLGFEFKRTTAPTLTPSMRVAMKDLELTRLDVVHAGPMTFDLAPKIRAVAARTLTRV